MKTLSIMFGRHRYRPIEDTEQEDVDSGKGYQSSIIILAGARVEGAQQGLLESCQ